MQLKQSSDFEKIFYQLNNELFLAITITLHVTNSPVFCMHGNLGKQISFFVLD